MPKTIHPYFKNRIREMVELGYSAPDIQKTFELNTPDNLFDQMPSLRTIQRLVKENRKADRQDWKITDCQNPEDARIVLDACAVLFAWYQHIGSPSISVDLADMIIRVVRSSPGLPLEVAVRFAIMLLNDIFTDEVYAVLSFTPYTGNYCQYIHHIHTRWSDFEAHAIFKRIITNVNSYTLWDFTLDFRLDRLPKGYEWLTEQAPYYDLGEGMQPPDFGGDIVSIDFSQQNGIDRIIYFGTGNS